MNQPLPEEERLARARAQRKAWWEANPNYHAEYYTKNREKDLEQKRLKRVADKADSERRQRAVERSGEWAKANPEKRREARERYKAKNPKAYRSAQRDYYHRNKERILARQQARESAMGPEKLREIRRRNNVAERGRGGTSTPSQEQRQRYRAQELERKKLERRLHRVGLPPRRVRRTLVSERRGNLAAAERFFSTNQQQRHEMLRRIREGDAEKGSVPPELLREWKLLTAKIRERSKFREELPGKVQKYLEKHGTRLRDEIALDSRARELRGKSPVNEDVELRRRVIEALTQATPAFPEEAAQQAPQSRTQAVGRRPPAPGSSAPHVFPGGVSPQGPRLN